MEEEVVARIVVAQHGEQISVTAYVSSLEPRVLTWQMRIAARTSGGTSNTLQSGSVQTFTGQPVVSVHLNGEAQGEVRLDVFEKGSHVASQRLTLQQNAPF